MTSTQSSIFDRRNVNDGLAFDEIREEKIYKKGQDRGKQLKPKTDAICDVCLVANLSKSLAVFMCYVCEQYLCKNCFKGHESHECITLVRERSERDGQIESFLDEMINESERKEKFEQEIVSMVDRVNVKNGFGQDCWITGLCGLDNTSWVVSDYNNSCIKIFNVGSNLLQRYLRLESKPWDVTEIKGKSESTYQGDMSAVDISATNQGKQDKQSFLAVTLPWEQRILIIDVTQNPAVITQRINTKQCFSIEFSEDHLVTLCTDGNGQGSGSLFISVKSIDGGEVKTIKTDVQFTPWSYLVVCSRRFHITHMPNDKVLCLNDEGRIVSHKTLLESHPRGISVDPETNHLYICDYTHDKVLRLDSSLESSETLFEFKSVNSGWPLALCLQSDKLYVSHVWGSTHGNFVTVVRVL